MAHKRMVEEGPQKDFISRRDMYYVIYNFSEDVYSYSYSVINTS
jgi:hypothetical protein